MSFFLRLPLIFYKSSLVKSTQIIEIYPKTTFPGTYATSCLKSWWSFSLSDNDKEEAAQSAGETKSSCDPKKCDGKWEEGTHGKVDLSPDG